MSLSRYKVVKALNLINIEPIQ